jgi:putative transposase
MWRPDGTVRKLRETFNKINDAHELTFSCSDGRRLLSSDRSRLWFVHALDRARRMHGMELWAYVIMPEHAHVLFVVRNREYRVEEILKSVKQSVSKRAVAYLRQASPQYLEKLRVMWPSGRVEHRFWEQGGGYDRNVHNPKVSWNSVNYIHMNPVRRGLVQHSLDWEWSSARWYARQSGVRLEMDAQPS